MSLLVRWTPKASNDLHRLNAFLANKDLTTAETALASIHHAIGLLCDFPDIGRRHNVAETTREWFADFGKSSYVIRYRHSQEQAAIVILRIWHSREQRH